MTDWDRTIIVPLAEADGRNIGNGIAAAAMICRDCGFIRLHGRDLLLN
jgi:hypothetical protein